MVNDLHDFYRHLYKHPQRPHSGGWWVIATLELCFLRMFSELGRLCSTLAWDEYDYLG